MPETKLAIIRLVIFAAGLIGFLIPEIIRPYRPDTISKFKRWAANLGLSAFNTVLLNLVLAGAAITTAQYVTENNIGVLNLIAVPWIVKTLITLAFMDFMLYVWHLLNHEMPFLWRFHRVHHSDLNMDVSTATRFHFGELLISAAIKISLIYFLGADVIGVVIFESLLVLAAQFQHSSLKVSKRFEVYYWTLFVPPSMHRIHHSVVIKERNTNYGTIFSLWDRFLGTMLSQVDQDRIKIGVGAYRNEKQLGLHYLLAMPFKKPIK